MKNFLRIIISILCFFLSLISYSYEITKIDITGLNTLSRGSVLSYLPVEIGDEFSDSISDISIKNLYKTNFFKDISISFENDSGVLSINLIENPTISVFEIKGYKNDRVLNEQSIENYVKDFKLSVGNLFNSKNLNDLIKSLEYTYEKSGFYNAKINSKINTDISNRIEIVIDITENDPTKIKTFEILGSEVYEEEELLNLFEIGEPDFFLINYWTEKDDYSSFEYQAGIEKLKNFYFNKGYLEFAILKEDLSYSKDKSSVDIKVLISEGKRYKIDKINFSGDFLNLSVFQLSQLLGLNSGDFFERSKVVSGLEKINNFFGDQGFAFVKVDAKTIDNSSDKNVYLDINIVVNERVYINRIAISGNNRTQDDVIRREINLLEGQQYSLSELEKSVANIKRLGYFDSVDMKTDRLKEFPDKINIFFEVAETKTGEFSVGVSQSNTTGAAFTLGIREKNFLGTGNTLNAKLISSEAIEELSFFFLDPDFNDQKHTISYGASSKTVNSAYIDLSSYNLNEIAVNGSYGIPISEYGKFNNGFRISSTDLTCGSVYSAYEPNQCSSNESKTDFSLVSSVVENSLNDSTYPSDGRLNNLTLNLATPLGDLNYYKLDLKHDSYYPISENLTAKVGANFGFIDSYNNKDTPFYKKYFAGGASSIRGFLQNSLGPKYPDGSVKGGEVSYLFSSSLISPITFIDDSNNMRIGAFVEMGSVHESISNIDSNDLRASAGLGFSWKTPIGPIGVHLAKPLIKKDEDSLESFAFTLGSSF